MTVTPARTLVLVLATARLTRFITTDWLGEWAVVRPIKKRIEPIEAAAQQELYDALPGPKPPLSAMQLNNGEPLTWQAKAAKGLDCPFCVGFWIGGVVLAADAVLAKPARAVRPVGKLWALGLGALALNYFVGHLSSKID